MVSFTFYKVKRHFNRSVTASFMELSNKKIFFLKNDWMPTLFRSQAELSLSGWSQPILAQKLGEQTSWAGSSTVSLGSKCSFTEHTDRRIFFQEEEWGISLTNHVSGELYRPLRYSVSMTIMKMWGTWSISPSEGKLCRLRWSLFIFKGNFKMSSERIHDLLWTNSKPEQFKTF